MLNLNSLTMCSKPFPHGTFSPASDLSVYDSLVASFPNEKDFVRMEGAYNKYSLSERNNPECYIKFIAQSEPWNTFHRYIKSKQFMIDVLRPVLESGPSCLLALKKTAPEDGRRFSARFEFSSLPTDGGFLMPHRDIPSKIITLVIPMNAAPTDWGGDTDILEPIDTTKEMTDYKEPWEAFRVVRTCPYAPNTGTIFLKTENSWHGVRPLQGPSGQWRRSVTINIEVNK